MSASICAMNKARHIGWGKFIISALSPFNNDARTLANLNKNAAEVICQIFPEVQEIFDEKGW